MDFNGYVNHTIQIIAHPLTLMMFGLLTHFIKALAETKKNAPDKVVTFRSYYLSNPFQTILSLVGALIGYVFIIGELDIKKLNDVALDAIRINAFFIGYMADSMIDILGQRSSIRQPKENQP